MIWYAPPGWAMQRYGKLIEESGVLDRPSPVLEAMRREAEAAPRPLMPIEEATYEQWIGLLYACAVFRGVLTHPVAWPYDKPASPVGYVARVGH